MHDDSVGGVRLAVPAPRGRGGQADGRDARRPFGGDVPDRPLPAGRRIDARLPRPPPSDGNLRQVACRRARGCAARRRRRSGPRPRRTGRGRRSRMRSASCAAGRPRRTAPNCWRPSMHASTLTAQRRRYRCASPYGTMSSDQGIDGARQCRLSGSPRPTKPGRLCAAGKPERSSTLDGAAAAVPWRAAPEELDAGAGFVVAADDA